MKTLITPLMFFLLPLCLPANATTVDIPTGKTNVVLSSDEKENIKVLGTNSAGYIKIQGDGSETINLASGNRVDAKSPVLGSSTPALMIQASKDNFKLKKIFIDGIIDGRTQSTDTTNDDKLNGFQNGLEIVGNSNNDTKVFFDMSITDGLHFGANAKVIGSNNPAFVIKKMNETSYEKDVINKLDKKVIKTITDTEAKEIINKMKKFKGSILNEGAIGDAKGGVGISLQEPIEGSLTNKGTIEGKKYGLTIYSPINGDITNYGTIQCYGDIEDYTKNLDGTQNNVKNPAAVYIQNHIRDITFINYGKVQGCIAFYNKDNTKNIKITNHGYIEGWMDCKQDETIIKNSSSGMIVANEVDAKKLVNSGKIIIKPEATGDQTIKALKVMENMHNISTGNITMDGDYWLATKTVNDGVFIGKQITAGNNAAPSMEIKNKGIFVFETITGVATSRLNIENTNKFTLNQGNTVKSYKDTGGKLQLMLAQIAPSEALLITKEAATFSESSTIELTPADFNAVRNSIKNNPNILVVAAGTLKANSSIVVTSGHMLMKVIDTQITSNELKATIQIVSPSEALNKKEVGEEVAMFANTLFAEDQNSEPMKQVTQLLKQVYGDITNAKTPEELKAYVEAITPEKTDVATAVASDLGGQAEVSVVNHVSSVRAGVNTGDTSLAQGCAIWGQPILNVTKKDPTALSSGYTSDFRGFTLGIEEEVSQLIYGGAWNYTTADIEFDNSKNKDQHLAIDMSTFLIYMNKKINNLFVESLVSAGKSKHRMQRLKGEAKIAGKYNSYQYRMQLGGGVTIPTGKIVIEPKLLLKLSALHTNAYELKNKFTEFSQAEKSSDLWNIDAGLALRLMAPLASFNDAELMPYISLMYSHNLYRTKVNKEVIFAYQSFPVTEEKVTDRFGTELGLNFAYKQLEFNASYAVNWKKNLYSQNLATQLKVKF